MIVLVLVQAMLIALAVVLPLPTASADVDPSFHYVDTSGPAGFQLNAAMVQVPNGDMLLTGGQFINDAGTVYDENAVFLSADGAITWEQVATDGTEAAGTMFGPRRYHAMAVTPDNGDVFLLGGLTESSNRYNDAWLSHGPEYRAWIQLNNTGVTLDLGYRFHVLTVGNFLHCLGNNDNGAFHIAANLDHFYTSGGTTLHWTVKAAKPGATVHTTAAAIDDETIFAGFGYPDTNEMFHYQRSSDVWTALTPTNPPPARRHAQAGFIGGAIVLLGGNFYGDKQNDVWRTADGGHSWQQVLFAGSWPAEQTATSRAVAAVVFADSGLVTMRYAPSDASAMGTYRLECPTNYTLTRSLICITPRLDNCNVGSDTSLVELALTTNADNDLVPRIVANAAAPGRTVTKAVLVVPTASGSCEYSVRDELTCIVETCDCSTSVSGVPLLAHCGAIETTTSSGGIESFEAAFVVEYEDEQTDSFGNPTDPVSYSSQAAVTVTTAESHSTDTTAGTDVLELRLVSYAITPAATPEGNATTTIVFKIISSTSYTGLAVVAASHDAAGVATAFSPDPATTACGSETCTHELSVTLATPAATCNFNGHTTVAMQPSCAGGACDGVEFQFAGTITTSQSYTSNAACQPGAAAEAALSPDLQVATTGTLVSSASPGHLEFTSKIVDGDGSDVESTLVSVSVGIHDDTTLCTSNLATLQDVHDGTGLTAAGTALGSLTVTAVDAYSSTIAFAFTMDNVLHLSDFGVSSVDGNTEMRDAFQATYRTQLCVAVTRQAEVFEAGRLRRLVTVGTSSATATAISSKRTTAPAEVVAVAPPAGVNMADYTVDASTVVLMAFTTTDATVLQDPITRDALRTAVTTSVAAAAGVPAASVVVVRMAVVEGGGVRRLAARRGARVEVETVIVLRGAAGVVQVQMVAAHAAVSSALADDSMATHVNRKLSEAGVNNVQHDSGTVTSGTSPVPVESDGLPLFATVALLGGIALAALALIAALVIVVTRRRLRNQHPVQLDAIGPAGDDVKPVKTLET